MKRFLMLLLLVLASLPASAAIGYDHSTACASDPNNATYVQCALSATSSGNLSVIVVQMPALNEVLTISDSAGNSYQTACSTTGGNPLLWAYYARNVSPGITWVRASRPGPGNDRMVVWHMDVSGADQGAPLDLCIANYSAFNYVSSWTSATGTTAQAREILITVAGEYYTQSTGVWSAGTVKAGGASYTQVQARNGGANVYNQGHMQYYITSSIDTYRGNGLWSVSTGEKYAWVFMSFKEGVFLIPHRGQVY